MSFASGLVCLPANVTATGAVIDAAAQCGARLVYVSTDYVFDGLKDSPYTETDATGPVNFYGETKLAGERLVAKSSVPWLIVRVSTLFGPGRSTFVESVIRRAEAGESATVFVDQTTSPTYAVDAAEGLMRLIDVRATGVVHVVNAGAASRVDVATAALTLWGLPRTALRVVRMADARLPARRPPNSSLAVNRLQQWTGWSPPTWQTALAQHLTWLKHSTISSNA